MELGKKVIPGENDRADIIDDFGPIVRFHMDRFKVQLDRHSQTLAERTEVLTRNGITFFEAAAGVVAVVGAISTVIPFLAARA